MEEVQVERRIQWGSKLQFILACIGYCVGLGNIWRFPYLCFESGGGAFLIPYIMMLVLCGIPLLHMELGIGQITRLGPVHAMWKLCPLFKGGGVAMVIMSFILATYYSVIMSWALNYFFHSFNNPLPWKTCNNTWNDGACMSELENPPDQTFNSTVQSNYSSPNATEKESPSFQYFRNYILDMSSGIDDMGEMNWEMFGCLLLSSVITFCSIFKSVKSLGKVVYVTAILPYFMLVVLLIRSVSLDGAADGIYFYLVPDWKKLGEAEVWLLAAVQIFNSIGISFGSLIAFSSYNPITNNVCRDTMIVAMINSATSFLAGLVVFSALGGMAKTLGVTVKEAVRSGPELVFVALPSLFNHLPLPNLWAVIFFLMLISLGIDSQFGNVEVVCTTLVDALHKRFKNVKHLKELVAFAVCLICFLLGLPNVTQGGIYYFTLVDNYCAVVSLMIIAVFEVVTISWVFGGRRLAREINFVSGHYSPRFFLFCWLCVSPIVIMVITFSTVLNFDPIGYGGYELPIWAKLYGTFITLSSVIWIPIGAIHEMYRNEGSFIERLKKSVRPTYKLQHLESMTEKRRIDSQEMSLMKRGNP